MTPAKIGFGCYRTDYRVGEHYKSLYKAIRGGITTIDTSSNYSDGGSEILVGNVVTDLINENKIVRSDITIITKAGYIQGKNFKLALDRKRSGNPYSEVVEYSKNLWHCINPVFLQDQINMQMDRLKQNHSNGYIDVYLLHNPEYFFGWVKNKNDFITAEDVQIEFYSRIKRAFEFLEEKVKNGIIRYYGISSNTFPLKTEVPDFISLEKIIRIAAEVSSNSHFKYIQFPFNLLEPGALLERNQRNKSATVLDIALKNKLYVLINRPLNAISAKGLIRLADFPVENFSDAAFQKQIEISSELETGLIEHRLEQYSIDGSSRSKLKAILQIAGLIKENWNNFTSIEHLNDIVENYFNPRIKYLSDLFHSGQFDNETVEYFDNYLDELRILIRMLINIYRRRANRRNSYIKDIVDSYLKKDLHHLTLSQKAVQVLRSVGGVGCVLVGAKRLSYTEEMLDILNTDSIPKPVKIFNKLQKDIIKEE